MKYQSERKTVIYYIYRSKSRNFFLLLLRYFSLYRRKGVYMLSVNGTIILTGKVRSKAVAKK
nr:MAG TPA: hypothetical protein [Caudoviricetes sp.]